MYYISTTTAPAMAPPTDRQVQIAELRNKGLTQEQIAKELGIARSTVAREWAAVKSEMSDLPLRYEEPKVIEPENDPKLSNSIVVELNGLDFEKFRRIISSTSVIKAFSSKRKQYCPYNINVLYTNDLLHTSVAVITETFMRCDLDYVKMCLILIRKSSSRLGQNLILNS